MPLDFSRFRLTPNIGAFGQGLQTGQNFQLNRTRLKQMKQQQEAQEAQFDREAQIRQLLGQIGGQQPQTQQQAQLAAQTADFNPLARDELGQQVAAERPQINPLADIRQQARSIDPVFAEKMLKSIGIDEESQRTEASRFAAEIERLPEPVQNQRINQRIASITARGGNPEHTAQLLEMGPQERAQALQNVQLLDLSSKERFAAQKGIAKTAQEASELSEPAKVQSSVILDDGTVQIVRKDGTFEIMSPDQVGKDIINRAKERGVDLQQRRAQGRTLGKDAAKTAQTAFEETTKLRDNNNTLRQVITTVEGGAGTGPLLSRLPSFRTESVRLDNMRRRLGLDVIGSVTFGALSEGEMELALDTALPTGLDGPELVQWAKDKIEAQEKLATYLEDQSVFLSEKGNTPAKWLKQQRALRGANNLTQEAPEPPGGVENLTVQATETPSGQRVGRFVVEVE